MHIVIVNKILAVYININTFLSFRFFTESKEGESANGSEEVKISMK